MLLLKALWAQKGTWEMCRDVFHWLWSPGDWQTGPGVSDTLQHVDSHPEELSLPTQGLTSFLSAERVQESHMLWEVKTWSKIHLPNAYCVPHARVRHWVARDSHPRGACILETGINHKHNKWVQDSVGQEVISPWENKEQVKGKSNWWREESYHSFILFIWES